MDSPPSPPLSRFVSDISPVLHLGLVPGGGLAQFGPLGIGGPFNAPSLARASIRVIGRTARAFGIQGLAALYRWVGRFPTLIDIAGNPCSCSSGIGTGPIGNREALSIDIRERNSSRSASQAAWEWSSPSSLVIS